MELKESVEVIDIVEDLYNKMDHLTEWERKFVLLVRCKIHPRSFLGIPNVLVTLWPEEHRKIIQIWSQRI